MTEPFFGVPPEVHSGLLNSGPGSGPLLVAAASWNALSVEYALAAEKLGAELGAVSAGVWQGRGATSYAGAHEPYRAWLTKTSVDCAAAAAQHEVMAAAYTGALAEMPTVAELAANHVAHEVLSKTNFFGLNTIPLAVNEATYVEMWVRAASAMSAYQAASSAVLASGSPATPAPPLLNAGVGAANAVPASFAAPEDLPIIIVILLQIILVLLELLFAVVAYAIIITLLLPLVILAEALTFALIGIILTPPFLIIATPFVLVGTPMALSIVLPTALPIGVGGYLADQSREEAPEDEEEPGAVTVDALSVAARPGVAPPDGLVSAVAADRGAGTLGFAGTLGKECVGRPVGLTVCGGDLFGDAPRVPMLPTSWEPDMAGGTS